MTTRQTHCRGVRSLRSRLASARPMKRWSDLVPSLFSSSTCSSWPSFRTLKQTQGGDDLVRKLRGSCDGSSIAPSQKRAIQITQIKISPRRMSQVAEFGVDFKTSWLIPTVKALIMGFCGDFLSQDFFSFSFSIGIIGDLWLPVCLLSSRLLKRCLSYGYFIVLVTCIKPRVSNWSFGISRDR